MNDYTKGKEYAITIGIPLATGIILGSLEVFGKDYVTPIVLIGLGAFICLGIVIFGIRFLEKRELRWIGNKNAHDKFNQEIDKLKGEMSEIKSNIKIDTKVNKLESRISYIEGRLKK